MTDKSWDGNERREGMKEVSRALEEIKLTLAEMKPSVALIEKHNETLYGNGQEGLTTKVDHIKGIRFDLAEHATGDHRFFTAVIGILLVILGKLFIK